MHAQPYVNVIMTLSLCGQPGKCGVCDQPTWGVASQLGVWPVGSTCVCVGLVALYTTCSVLSHYLVFCKVVSLIKN